MCGIVGFVGARADMQEILQGMMDAIAHRGPDGQGQFIEGPAALGQRRQAERRHSGTGCRG